MAVLRGGQEAVTGKPTVSELGIDLAAQAWQRSGPEHGARHGEFDDTATHG